jgi:NAD(P)-dependent dehydrogenase (short-subunit alcohol dehydrogenase family)
VAAAPGARVDARSVDLASLSSVRAFAERLIDDLGALDVLVNNAGVAGGPRRETRDGHEMHFQVNHLAHFALAGRLLPALCARPDARVVSISSEIASSAALDFDDLQSQKRYRFVSAYARSKLANLLFARELERRSRAARSAVRSFAAHPGVATSNLLVGKEPDWGRGLRGMERVVRLVQLVIGQPAAMGALPALYQATDGDADPARYIGPKGLVHGRGIPGPCAFPEPALDAAAAERLWVVSTELTGVTYEISSGDRSSSGASDR